MPGGEPHITYLLQQQVKQRHFVADGMPEAREEYERVGFLLLSQASAMGRWRRTFEELESSKAFVDSLRRQAVVERQVLAEKHQAAMEARKLEFGLRFPLEIESDAANLRAAMPASKPIPTPFYMLYLPTLLPSMPPEPKIGSKWNGSIKVNCRGGEFEIGYSAALARGEAGFDVAIALDEKVLVASSELMTLQFKPTGAWTINHNQIGDLPASLRGAFAIVVHGIYTNMRGKLLNVDLINLECKFDITRVPVAFDDKRLVLNAWQLK